MRYLRKIAPDEYFYQGEKANYYGEVDGLGNGWLTVVPHGTKKSYVKHFTNELKSTDKIIENIEAGKGILVDGRRIVW